ncbi:unnamed protein product [Pleuronectes platessa]|uniref:Uncharacterized protein n=1 Tax=Pleuronectes platessa TaxID=8262 RepID=A0A9N7VFE5_PLEPL|nr:unnamed protein product [Pleuronectes platessa]
MAGSGRSTKIPLTYPHILSTNMEEAGIMTYTAASHQVAVDSNHAASCTTLFLERSDRAGLSSRHLSAPPPPCRSTCLGLTDRNNSPPPFVCVCGRLKLGSILTVMHEVSNEETRRRGWWTRPSRRESELAGPECSSLCFDRLCSCTSSQFKSMGALGRLWLCVEQMAEEWPFLLLWYAQQHTNGSALSSLATQYDGARALSDSQRLCLQSPHCLYLSLCPLSVSPASLPLVCAVDCLEQQHGRWLEEKSNNLATGNYSALSLSDLACQSNHERVLHYNAVTSYRLQELREVTALPVE